MSAPPTCFGEKMSENISFSYKNGTSPVHRMPAWIKILLLPVLNIVFFNLPVSFSAVMVAVQTAVLFSLRFSLKEQFADLKPVLFYAAALYLTAFAAHFFDEIVSLPARNFAVAAKNAAVLSFSNASSAVLLLKIFCLMQSASILFRTSTPLEIRGGVGAIEHAVRKILPFSKKNTLTNTVSLFVCFIPLIFKIWNETKRAWLARCGKKSLKMYSVLFTTVFTVGLKKASNTARAVAARTV